MAAGGGCHPTPGHLLAELLGVRCVSKGGFLGGSCLLGQLKKNGSPALALAHYTAALMPRWLGGQVQ